ncbi:LPS export ABC transporter permease LptG [Rubellimicrobium roseum]|uniref:LPS export ABC transporter permease LptG n=1 Tax=Rubellimicrobium roseum TaxID=687525 RepID=A0A5C4NLT0_9RHOB|nr:LPS export ABC transporter permease LptG [Rubellimicrobium roseum]TNC73369.1 LPS export ABC transporter permease LptG [Rubellimicrobium roseum]
MILDRYLARRFLRTFLGTLAVFFGILALIDLVEQIRRHSDDVDGLGPVLALTLLNVPASLYEILPLVMIIAAITLFLGLGRSSELVVTRGSGRSALRALLGPAVVALLLGALAVAAFNPIVAATSREYESRLDRLEGAEEALALAGDALWLRQGGPAGPAVIRAERSNLDGTVLSGVTFLTYDPDGRPRERIEAQDARLEGGQWVLGGAKLWRLGAANPEAEAETHESWTLPSTLTADQIRDSFGEPSAIPIWELPRFIARLEEAGFAAQRHRVFLQMELAQPLFLLAMVLVAAGFTMHHQRGRRTGVLVMGAILMGFGVYFLRSLSQILGEAGNVPPALAAWAPPVAAIGLALGLLLHLEEG